jgi:hypothetical protein
MLRRLLLGVLKGTLIGLGVGSLLVFVLGLSLMSGLFGYLAAVFTGVCVALLAGKPIWARGAWIEVLLKGVAAAVLGAGLLYGVRTFLDTSLALGFWGSGSVSQLPLVVLPLVATVLAVFFEIDNTDDPAERLEADRQQRLRVTDRENVDEADALEASSESAGERRASHKQP